VHIKKIVKDSIKDFPHLTENGYTDVDMYRLWLFYEKELVNYLIEPDKPFVKLFFFGSLGLTVKKLSQRIYGFEKIESMDNRLLSINPDKTVKKLKSLKQHVESKILHYKAVIDYLEDYNTKKSKQSLIWCNWQIENLEDQIKRINILIEKNVERITTRSLEEQKSNS